jgi:hypothetical protein
MQCLLQFQKENPELPVTRNPMTSGPVRPITTMQTITAYNFEFAGKTNLFKDFLKMGHVPCTRGVISNFYFLGQLNI